MEIYIETIAEVKQHFSYRSLMIKNDENWGEVNDKNYFHHQFFENIHCTFIVLKN